LVLPVSHEGLLDGPVGLLDGPVGLLIGPVNKNFFFIQVKFYFTEVLFYFCSLSSLHESFGSPSSPREVQSLLKPRSPASGQLDTARNTSQPTDQQMPGFATSLQDFTPAKQTSGSRSAAGNQARPQDFDMSRQLGILLA
jgi:hypothetical protein